MRKTATLRAARAPGRDELLGHALPLPAVDPAPEEETRWTPAAQLLNDYRQGCDPSLTPDAVHAKLGAAGWGWPERWEEWARFARRCAAASQSGEPYLRLRSVVPPSGEVQAVTMGGAGHV